MNLFWSIVILYLVVSAPLTYWNVRADIPMILEFEKDVSYTVLVISVFCVWLLAPILLGIHFYRGSKK